MKKTIIISALIAGLAGCSSDNDPVPPTDKEIANTLLNGVWLSECVVANTSSTQGQYTFNDGTGHELITQYTNTTCDSVPPVLLADNDFTYTLGDEVTLDGSIAGLTSGRELDMVFPASADRFAIYAMDGLITLYLDESGRTLETRPTQLRDSPLTLQ